MVSFSRVVQFRRYVGPTPNLSMTSVSAGTLIANNLPICSACNRILLCAWLLIRVQVAYCDRPEPIMQLLQVIGVTLEQTLRKLSIL